MSYDPQKYALVTNRLIPWFNSKIYYSKMQWYLVK